MIRFTAFAAAMALATMLSSVVAKAEFYYGPTKNGNQCYIQSGELSNRAYGWGHWEECPKPASTTPTITTRRVRNSTTARKQQ
jgi:hypothetical protein